MKKILCVLIALMILLSTCVVVFAGLDMAEGVTEEMCKPSYWKNRTYTDADEVIMTADDIRAFNKNAYESSNTYIVGIENIKPVYKADYQRTIITCAIPSRTLYINGVAIDKQAYFQKMNDAILNTGYTDIEKETEYAIVVRQTDMKEFPTLDMIGYSATDVDDEFEYENLSVNEPFAIRGMCIIDDVKFYYGWSTDCVGWVPANDLAICSSKEEWLDAWYNEIESKDFIVVTQDRLYLEPSINDSDLSNLKLLLGTSLKLVSDDQIPELVDKRNTWHNYVVYVPTRDVNGNYVKKVALIPKHYNISVGYLPFTQANLIDVSFTCLGNRYGWGGMLDLYDCSLYTRTIFRCFGLTYPRNATWQRNVSGTAIDMTQMSDEQKQALIGTLPTGTTFFFPGHTMMYLGCVDGVAYVINDLGTVVESTGSNEVKTVYNVVINPLTVRRGASYGYTTWLHNLTTAVMVMPKSNINSCDISAVMDKDSESPLISVKYKDNELIEDINYTVSVEGEKVVITGINNFTGYISVDIHNSGADYDSDSLLELLIYRIVGFFEKIFAFLKELM